MTPDYWGFTCYPITSEDPLVRAWTWFKKLFTKPEPLPMFAKATKDGPRTYTTRVNG
jgi:hypothetical protein